MSGETTKIPLTGPSLEEKPTEAPAEVRTSLDAADTAPESTSAEPVETTAAQKEESKKARTLGEDRSLLLKTMLSDAEKSDSAKQALLKLLEERPSLAKVAEEKYSDKLSGLRGEKASKDENLTTEELKMSAKAELYFELEQKEQEELTISVAEKIGMNEEEASILNKLAQAYSETTGVDFKTALLKMAHAEKPDHAASLSMPKGSSQISAAVTPITVTDEDKKMAKQVGKDPAWIAEKRVQLEESLGTGKFVSL